MAMGKYKFSSSKKELPPLSHSRHNFLLLNVKPDVSFLQLTAFLFSNHVKKENLRKKLRVLRRIFLLSFVK
jgi:hypothetical protein